MILPEHKRHFERLRSMGAFRSPMLMLGNQESLVGVEPAKFFGVPDYTTLDPDGGDLRLDLSKAPPTKLISAFACVFNLGTIEHVWDIHAAYCNAARMVMPGGVFIGHAPVGGWERHGVHVTDSGLIQAFFRLNGFRIDAAWHALKDGRMIGEITRGGGCQTLWMVATKLSNMAEFVAPQQVFRDGAPVSA